MRTGTITFGSMIFVSGAMFYYVLKPTAITGTTTMLQYIFLAAMALGALLMAIGILLPARQLQYTRPLRR